MRNKKFLTWSLVISGILLVNIVLAGWLINAFINNGSLTTNQGQALIDAANAIKTSLGC